MYATTSEFDANKLQFEHANAIDNLTSEQRKICLFSIINGAKLDEVLPSLMESEESQKKFSTFLKLIFNSSIIQMLQIGSKKQYK